MSEKYKETGVVGFGNMNVKAVVTDTLINTLRTIHHTFDITTATITSNGDMNLILVINLMCLASGIVFGTVLSRKIIISELDYPRYAFNYAINDPLTKDNKAQWEARNGDTVNGAYSLREPDGTIRVVEYSANDINGFNAVVKKIGTNGHSTLDHGAVSPNIATVKIIRGKSKTSIKSINSNYNYGFGAAALAIGLPKVTSLGDWSLKWDPLTRSYGGWVPINGPINQGPYATVYSKKYVNGKLHKWSSGPIIIQGKKLIIKTKN